jgi:hypothetical protein
VILAGDWVILKTLPSWVAKLPPDSQQVFAFCIGRAFRVDAIDEHSHLVLDVSVEVDPRFGGCMNDIRVEAEHVALATPPSGSSA